MVRNSCSKGNIDERSWFNIRRLERCGDIHLNPGPIKFPCKECEKSVRNNQNAMLCSECGCLWIHAKCLNMSTSTFKYFLEWPTIDWICPLCSLPRLGDSFFLVDEENVFSAIKKLVQFISTLFFVCCWSTPLGRDSRDFVIGWCLVFKVSKSC